MTLASQAPQVPSGYDAAHAAGWTYHRNGVSGCGFYAKVEDGALHVAWCEYDEATEGERFPVAATVPLPVLAGLAKLPAVGPTIRRDEWRSHGQVAHVVDVDDASPQLHVYDSFPDDRFDVTGRVLVVSDLIEGEDPRVAAFLLAELLDGDASTTLRGDVLYREALAAAAAAKEAESR